MERFLLSISGPSVIFKKEAEAAKDELRNSAGEIFELSTTRCREILCRNGV